MVIGATVLDIAKRSCFNLKKNENEKWKQRKMKTNLNLEILYSNMDSFNYAIKTDDVYQFLEKKKLILTFQILIRTISCSTIPTGSRAKF